MKENQTLSFFNSNKNQTTMTEEQITDSSDLQQIIKQIHRTLVI
jgi:hypothetical protein